VGRGQPLPCPEQIRQLTAAFTLSTQTFSKLTNALGQRQGSLGLLLGFFFIGNSVAFNAEA